MRIRWEPLPASSSIPLPPPSLCFVSNRDLLQERGPWIRPTDRHFHLKCKESFSFWWRNVCTYPWQLWHVCVAVATERRSHNESTNGTAGFFVFGISQCNRLNCCSFQKADLSAHEFQTFSFSSHFSPTCFICKLLKMKQWSFLN